MNKHYTPLQVGQLETETRFHGFVKMTRSPDLLELIAEAPMAFTLAAVIALRARFRPGRSLRGLNPGEALIGDFTSYGMTEQQYRTAKRQLGRWGFATFTATTRGTVARLMDSRLFDVLSIASNGQINGQPTDSRRLTKNAENGENQDKGHRADDAPPSESEVRSFSEAEELNSVFVERFLEQRARDGWRIRGSRIRDWKATLRAFCAKAEGDLQKIPRNLSAPASLPEDHADAF